MLVPTGGAAFESFLEIMGSDTSVCKLHRHKQRCKDKNTLELMPEFDFEQILERDGGIFHGFVLLGVGNIGRKGKNQLYFPTFSARFHGLSRQGVQIQSHFGGVLSISTYDRFQKKLLLKIDEEHRHQQ